MKKICLLIGIISGLCFLSWNDNPSCAAEKEPGVAFSLNPMEIFEQSGSMGKTAPAKAKPVKSKYWSGKQNKQAEQNVNSARTNQTGHIRPVSDVVPRPNAENQRLRPGRSHIISAAGESLASVIEDIEDSAQDNLTSRTGIGKFFGSGGKSSTRPSEQTGKPVKRSRVSAEPGMQLLQENGVSAVETPAASAPVVRETAQGDLKGEAPVLVKEEDRDLKRRVSVPQAPSSPMQPLTGNRQQIASPVTAPVQTVKSPESGNFVIATSSPVIDIKTSGPKRIVVGQESVFQIHVRNTGTVPAEKLIVLTEIPFWVEIANITPSRGNSSLSPERKSNDAVVCQWRLDLLSPGKDEILTLRLVPRQRNNFELASQYDFEQSAMKAGIEVQEPLIELAIDGRDQIEWGAEDKYRLRVRNTGNGDATNLRLTVTTGDNQQVTHPLGLLKAGEERTMELAVKTHVEDKVNIRIDAAGDYGLSASTAKSITVLRGKIDVYAEVPELQFVNNSVDCLVRVANTGTAPLRNVKVALALPSEIKMISCSGDGQLEPDKGQVVWTIPGVSVGQEIVYQMTCQMVSPGTGRLNLAATDITGQTAVSDASIQIEAIASLRVDIKSPSGPIPVGSPIVYEVTVRNDGTRAARDVSAVLFLSKALCPTTVEHGAGVISPIDGKVVFNRIGILGPGQSTSYKVTAQVAAPGNHKVQAVLESGSEAIQLASEAMTYCYEKRTMARRDRGNKVNEPVTAQVPGPVEPQNPLNTLGTGALPAIDSLAKTPTPSVNQLPSANQPAASPNPFATVERVALQAMPQTKPQTVPQAMPQTMPQAMPQTMPQAMPQAGPLPSASNERQIPGDNAGTTKLGGQPGSLNESSTTNAAKPVNNPLLLTPFPLSPAKPAAVKSNANNLNSSADNTKLTEPQLPQLPQLPEPKKVQPQPETKTPEPMLQPVADRDLGRF